MSRFAEVAAFVAHAASEPIERITAETRILHDLRVDGDDADEFMMAFAARFQVDMSPFPFRDHFYGEPHLLSWGGLIQHVRGMQHSPKRPLTIAALVQAAQLGYWAEPSVSAVE